MDTPLASPPRTEARSLSRLITPVFAFWAVAAVVLTVFLQAAVLASPFVYTHGWISAHFAASARAFVDLGFWRLGGVPVVNNAPLGTEPEAYLHWPPLFSLALAVIYRIFGSTEFAAHCVMLGLVLINAALIGILVRKCLGGLAALVAVFGLMSLPVTILYSHLVWNLHLMMTFVLAALFALVKAEDGRALWKVIGCSAMLLAICTSWECFFLWPGLLLVSWIRGRRDEIRLSIAYAAVAVFGSILVLSIYTIQYPHQVTETVQIFLFRLGLVQHYVVNHSLQTTAGMERPSLLGVLVVYAARYLTLLNVTAIGSVTWWAIRMWRNSTFRQSTPAVSVMAALCSMWWLWFLIFWNHVLIHDCMMFLAAPAAAVAMGWAFRELTGYLQRRERAFRNPALAWGLVMIAPAIILRFPAKEASAVAEPRTAAEASLFPPDPSNVDGREAGLSILANTPPHAVVLASMESAVPIFYSQRHIVRGVFNDKDLAEILPTLPALFPGSAYFLAISPDSRDKFPEAVRRFPTLRDEPAVRLLDLRQASPALQTRMR